MSCLKLSVLTNPVRVPILDHATVQIQLSRRPIQLLDRPLHSVLAVSVDLTRTRTSTSCKPTIPVTNFGNLSNIASPLLLLHRNLSIATTPHPRGLLHIIRLLNIPTLLARLQHQTTTPAPAITSTRMLPILPSLQTPAPKDPPALTIGVTTKPPPPSPASHHGNSANTDIPILHLARHDRTICQPPLQSHGMIVKRGINHPRILHASLETGRGELVVRLRLHQMVVGMSRARDVIVGVLRRVSMASRGG